MALDAYAIPAVVLVAITSMILLVSQDWRVSISALVVQYVGVFVLAFLFVLFLWVSTFLLRSCLFLIRKIFKKIAL